MMMHPPRRSQSPLNLVLSIRHGHAGQLLGLLQSANQGDKTVQTALKALGNVHHAQFVPLENDTRLGVFTVYDGDFDAYILSFVEHIGDIFNKILEHIEGGDQVVPVQAHAREFLDFVHKHDHTSIGLFSAYPDARVFDIQDALRGRP